MKSYVELYCKDDTQSDFSSDHRNLLSVAYKNVVGSKRSSHRVMGSIINKLKSDEKQAELGLATEYQAEIVIELEKVCKEVLVSLLLVELLMIV